MLENILFCVIFFWRKVGNLQRIYTMISIRYNLHIRISFQRRRLTQVHKRNM